MLAGCVLPFVETPPDVPPGSSLLMSVPAGKSYKMGDPFDPAADVTVYKLGEDGEKKILEFSNGDFTATLSKTGKPDITEFPHPLDEAGEYTVSVYQNTPQSGNPSTLILTVDPVASDVLVVPIRTIYAEGDTIDKKSDLIVFTRDISTRSMIRRDPDTFSLTPASPLIAKDSEMVTVTVLDYPDAGDTTLNHYYVQVNAGVTSSPMVQIVPYRTLYTVGDTVNKNELAVYIRNTTTGVMELIPEPRFDIVTPAGAVFRANAVGTRVITIRVNDYPAAGKTQTAGYTAQVQAAASGYSKLVQIVPFKTVYDTASPSINTATDLAVYTRNEATGEMTQITGGFTVSPDPLSGINPIIVTVAVAGYANATYQVWLNPEEAPFIPTLMVVPLKTGYVAGDKIIPDTELAVYKSAPGGAMNRIYYPSGFTLTLDDNVTNPAATAFSASGVIPITVKDTATGADHANDSTYTAQVTSPPIGILTVQYVDGSAGTMTRNVQGNYIIDTVRNKVIYTVAAVDPADQTITHTYLLGRMDYEPVTLNLDEHGVLSFRPPLMSGPSRGCIPIESVEELKMINNALSNRYALEARLDLLGDASYSAVLPAHKEWMPIGKDDTSAVAPFIGVFDGGNYLISNLSIPDSSTSAASDYNGLFARVGDGTAAGVVVRNVIVSGAVQSVSGKGYIGGVAGRVSKAVIENCENRAGITGEDTRAGGITGSVDGGATLTNCSNSGTITSNAAASGAFNHLGGLAGYVESTSTLTRCSNSGNVTCTGNRRGGIYLGGLAGYVKNSTLTNCSNSGNITISNGLTMVYAGGAAGYVDNVSILNCSNSGDISGTGSSGGVVGKFISSGTLTDCSNTGNVSGSGPETGGVAGSFGVGSNPTLMGCSNTGNVISSGSSIGGVAANLGGGSILNCSNYGNVISTFSGSTGGVVGINAGSVTNCSNFGYVTGRTTTGGVAGEVYGAATVTACRNINTVTGYGNHLGGLVGKLEGTITACYNTGTVEGYGDNIYTGGIAGVTGQVGAASIVACYSSGLVTGQFRTGGVGGMINLSRTGIYACYWDKIMYAGEGNGYPSGTPSGMTSYQPLSFPNVSTLPLPHAEWGTGSGGSGQWWKAGTTTGGGNLPRLWYE
jgi:hypothetical protein